MTWARFFFDDMPGLVLGVIDVDADPDDVPGLDEVAFAYVLELLPDLHAGDPFAAGVDMIADGQPPDPPAEPPAGPPEDPIQAGADEMAGIADLPPVLPRGLHLRKSPGTSSVCTSSQKPQHASRLRKPITQNAMASSQMIGT